MKFLDLVNKRRSVRKYKSSSISRDILDRCIEAARLAPSACNSQPWSFIIVDNIDLKNKLIEKAFSGLYSMNRFIKDAPVLVVVITEKSSYIAKLGGYLKKTQYSLIDVGIACEHFILQATEEGLGTCWLGWFNEKAVKKILNLDKNSKIDAIISVGYSEEDRDIEKNRKSIDKIRKFV